LTSSHECAPLLISFSSINPFSYKEITKEYLKALPEVAFPDEEDIYKINFTIFSV
jgi:hypothetical protein